MDSFDFDDFSQWLHLIDCKLLIIHDCWFGCSAKIGSCMIIPGIISSHLGKRYVLLWQFCSLIINYINTYNKVSMCIYIVNTIIGL